jgi:UDP-N-acetylmuramate-alanine ligase
VDSLKGKKIHFIGIGGSGMSGLARIALSDGITVTGSDAKDSTVLAALRALGAEVYSSHEAAMYTVQMWLFTPLQFPLRIPRWLMQSNAPSQFLLAHKLSLFL